MSTAQRSRPSRHRRRRRSSRKPPQRPGYRWWAYVLAFIVAFGAVGLSAVALGYDASPSATSSSITPDD